MHTSQIVTQDLSKFQKVFAVKSNVLVFAQAGRVMTMELSCAKRKMVASCASQRICKLQLGHHLSQPKALPGCIPISVIVTFLADYLATDQGMAVEAKLPKPDQPLVRVDHIGYLHFEMPNRTAQLAAAVKASTAITAVFGMSCLCFGVAGGFIGQKLWNLRCLVGR